MIKKVKFTLEQVTKAQRESRDSSPLSLTSALDGVGSKTTPGPGKRPGTHCTVCRVGPRVGLGECRKTRPHKDSIPGASNP